MRKLILFDVDGTLIWGGPARGAFECAMIEVFGTAGEIDGHDFSGKTDPQIARELLSEAGFTHQTVEEGLPALWDAYLRELEERLPEKPPVVLPGVERLLDRLDEADDVAMGLVTGNIRRGARLKLTSVGMRHRFRVGGFGSDHEVRDHLPGIAIQRAEEEWGVSFPPDRVVVVGDTEIDVASGRRAGTRTLAVATGHRSVEELEAVAPDWVFRDFSEADDVARILLG